MPRIQITLKSDLCAASGDGFAAAINMDISYDKYGFPFIGARRLKGCLREAAENIGVPKAELDAIFGVNGKSQGCLKLSDARLPGYDSMVQDIISSSISSEKIISLFTYTRASTALVNGTAMNKSLRFMRIVRHYSPLVAGKQELVFEAEAEADAAYGRTLENICLALRNIGFKRNRGFGAVACRWILDSRNQPENEQENDAVSFRNTLAQNIEAELPDTASAAISGDETCFSYLLRLEDDIMLPDTSDTETAGYIPGTAVLGYFASQYLEYNEADEKFEDMFTGNDLRFSNLYISNKQMRAFYPVPPIIGRIKGISGRYNVLAGTVPEGMIIKPYKSGYCDFACKKIMKPAEETIYHHTTVGNRILYTQTALARGQYLRGTVSGNRDYVQYIFGKMQQVQQAGGRLRFGRSRTAQYSGCSIVYLQKPAKRPVETVAIKSGEPFMALLCSDAAIPDGAGGYALSAEALRDALGDAFRGLEPDSGTARPCSLLKYHVVTGYSLVWGLKKPHFRTIAAGSALVFTAAEDMELPRYMLIGGKNREGFGSVMICRTAEYAPPLSEINEDATEETAAPPQLPETGPLAEMLRRNAEIEKMRGCAIGYVNDCLADERLKELNSTQLGRFLMMVTQARDKDALMGILKSDIVNGEHTRKDTIALFDIIQHDAFGRYGNETYWREYLKLVLTLLKYAKRR